MAEDSLIIRLREGNPHRNIRTPLANGLAWLAAADELARPHLSGCDVALRGLHQPDDGTWFSVTISRAGRTIWYEFGPDAEQLALQFAATAESGVWS